MPLQDWKLRPRFDLQCDAPECELCSYAIGPNGWFLKVINRACRLHAHLINDDES